MADSVTTTDGQDGGYARGGALPEAKEIAERLRRKWQHENLLGKLAAAQAYESTAQGYKSCLGWFATSLLWQLTLLRSSEFLQGEPTLADELYRALEHVLDRDPVGLHD